MRHALAIACTLALLHGLTAQAATDSSEAIPIAPTPTGFTS